jgi:arginine deiminase
MEVDGDLLSTILIGGMSRAELPIAPKGVLAPMLEPADFILPPLPNHIFTRDTTCWIYGGVTLNPMHWPARRLETLNLAAIYRFHPDFKASEFPIWWGDPTQRPWVRDGRRWRRNAHREWLLFSSAWVNAQRRKPSARLHAQSVQWGWRRRGLLPVSSPSRARASMHLDTVFTFCDRDLVTVFRGGHRCDPLLPVYGPA